jgi:lipopolysaccharide transport system ATP-binding protein
MRRSEIERKFDEIVAFSEIDEFLDTPVKRYSSGMYVRLAFAVAAHLEPEILIVDEVLAVGDIDFQKKCLGKMGEVASQGRTVLFVSHNMDAVNTLTQRSIVLSKGKASFIGKTSEALDYYLHPDTETISNLDYYRQAQTIDTIKFSKILINGKLPPQTIHFGSDLHLNIQFISKTEIQNASFTILIKDKVNRIVSSICSYDYEIKLPVYIGKNVLNLEISSLGLAPGNYYFDLAINPNFNSPWLDCLRNVPLGDIIITKSISSQSLLSPKRTWGSIHFFDANWEIKHSHK